MLRSYGKSILLHLALLGLALAVLDFPAPVEIPAPRVLELWELERLGGHRSGPHSSAGKRARAKARPRAKPPALGALGVFSGSGLPAPGSGDGASDSPYGFGDQLESGRASLLLYLFRRLDVGIGYPSDLSGHGIQGEVIADLHFDRSGKWIEDESHVKLNSALARFFRVYVLRRLRELLEEPLPANLWDPEQRSLDVEARFRFEIVPPETVIGAQVGPQYGPSADPTKFNEKDTDGGKSVEKGLIRARQGIYGRKFQFYRVHLASPLDWRLGPIAGYGILPVFSIDPSWFPKAIDDWIHHRAKIDPLDHYRDDPDW